jgi:hypothetical protein
MAPTVFDYILKFSVTAQYAEAASKAYARLPSPGTGGQA